VIGSPLVSGLTIDSGAIVQIVNSGVLTVSGGQTVDGATVSSGGEIVLGGGAVTDLTVSSGGIEAVGSGVALASPAIAGDTTLVVSSGGVVGGTVSFGSASELVVDAPAGLKGATLAGFAAGDTLDLAGFGFSAAETLGFATNGADTKCVLTITDGALRLAVTLLGQYMAAGFSLAADPGGGTDLTYTPPASAHLDLAAGH
jgi:hypothetical protein